MSEERGELEEAPGWHSCCIGPSLRRNGANERGGKEGDLERRPATMSARTTSASLLLEQNPQQERRGPKS